MLAYCHKTIVLVFLGIFVFISGWTQPVEIRTYHDEDSTLLKEIYYIENPTSAQLTGPYKSFYISGSLERKGFYEDNIPDSLWVYYYENGGVKMKGMLQDGATHGLWEYYYENGNLNMAGMVIDSEREGAWKYYYENGRLKSQGEYINNRKHGIWNYFYEEGELKAQAFYENGRGKYKEFYNLGNIKAEGLNVNGKSDSTWTFYFENGNIRARGEYEAGKRVGPWIFYHDNTNKSAEGNYADGKKEGKWVHYHENGNISSEGAIRSGRKEGYWKFFDIEGAFKAEGIFERNDGKYTEYYESGKIKAEGEIKDGKNHGPWHYFYEDGTREGECLYDNGNGEYIGYYPDGTVKMKGRIENGVNVGVWELYNGDGTLAGYYRPYYEDNKPVYKLVDKTTIPQRGDYIKPAYKFKSYKSRYFDPVINEYKGIILSTNPIGLALGQLPVSVEYYIEERLGYELQVGIIRDPFFRSSQNIEVNKVYDRGFNVALKQKFYHPEGRFGMFYFGHEVRLTSVKHYANVIDSVSAIQDRMMKINTSETRFEYALFVGDRWMQLFGERYKNNSIGFTIDAFIGFGFGYRLYQENFTSNPDYEQVFDDVNSSKFAVTPRLGINFGFIF